jgi:hypothetical protein
MPCDKDLNGVYRCFVFHAVRDISTTKANAHLQAQTHKQMPQFVKEPDFC